MRRAVIAAALVAAPAAAHAYPQFQVGKERSCTACHIAPSGGGLLDGMGGITAEDIATWDGDAGFAHGAIELPDWLVLGGDLRAAAGVHSNGDTPGGAVIPMQAEVYGAVKAGQITAYATVGFALARDNKPSNAVLAREHWLMYRTADGATPGFYVRAGRFMPIYGLRYAEHVVYTRRFGGTPLYGETYGVGGGYLAPGLEVHVTGFLRDRVRADFALERGDGAAVYAEKRFGDRLALGAEGRFARSPDERRAQGGLTGKLWLPGPSLQLSAELQLVRQGFDVGPARTQNVGVVMASWQGVDGLMIDLALNHFNEDLAIARVDRDAVDLNVHWFAHSHLELIWTSRFQMIGPGDGGDRSFYSLVQLHYRL